jgi:glutamate N-acetyltransferase/amino-acid N-acetyltransferase
MSEPSYFFVENGSVTTPAGFRASGVVAGFKRSGAPDFAMLVSEVPAHFAGAFTSCTFAAAPVRICQERVRRSPKIRAVIINSGNANACTGVAGLDNARKSCAIAAGALGIAPEEVMVSSTGRIGVQLDLGLIEKGVALAAAALSAAGGNTAARAIMTTDTVPKSVAVQLELGGKTISIGAMTKGAGMIDPNLKTLHATMLCYITTDAGIDNPTLARLIESGVEGSFNRITIDGDMSTNDTVIMLANGASGVKIAAGTPEFEQFKAALDAAMRELARQMVADGEGATKFVTIKVVHAPDREAAKKCAEAVANSLLCKTAWFGNDPNWGRVVAALGYSGAAFDPDKVNIYYDEMPVVKNGGDAGTPESELAAVIGKREFTVLVDLAAGSADYWVWTCDVSYEYVKINADYHT